jgi:hypothetical protein
MMTRHLPPIDISTSADLLRVAEEVAASGTGRLLVRGERPVAIVQPLPESDRPARRRRRPAEPADDPLLGIIGMLDTGEPTEIARFKDQYLADAVDRRSL